MEHYTRAAMERAMKVHEVILQAMAGKLKWVEAAAILGIQPRSVRRWRAKLERWGVWGLVDQRCRRPSLRRAPGSEVQGIIDLYRERYRGFNVRHFYEYAVEQHGVKRSYSFVKQVLQGAGLIRKQRARGRHRQRRERRASFGQMLHLDGSPHRWLVLGPKRRDVLITVVDDATSRLLYAQLWPAESRGAVMSALRAVFLEQGLPQQLYTDRAGWAAHTPRAGGPVDPRPRTQVEQALEELGIEHLRAYSPQARGRSERTNRTLQGRIVNELRLHGVTERDSANRYLHEDYRARHNARFAHPPADPRPAFVAVPAEELDRCLCVRGQRMVGRDNTVIFGKQRLQIPKQPGRRSCERLRVTVRQFLDGCYTVAAGARLLATYDAQGGWLAPESQLKPSRDRRSTAILRRHFSPHSAQPPRIRVQPRAEA